MGESFMLNREVNQVIGTRLALSVTLSLSTLVLVYLIAIPIGIYSATHQHSVGDYFATVFGFLGLATPNFLLALILMYLTFTLFGWAPGGLFSREYIAEGWSFGKVIDLIKHLPVPLIVIGTAGTAEIIRILRGTLLDELGKQYVITARTKGVGEGRLLIKYPVRMALNPIISTIGGLLPRDHFRSCADSHRAEPAHHRSAAAAGAPEPGHVSRRQHHHAPERARPDRDAGIRSAAAGRRSPHPLRSAGLRRRG